MAKGEAAAAAKTPDEPAAPPAAEPAPTEAKAAAAPAEPAEKPAKAEKTFTKSELDAANAKAVADALKKAEAEKDLSDLEKANNRLKELEEQIRLRDAKESGLDALKAAGARSPELMWEVLRGRLEFDDKGNAKNLDALVASFKTTYAEQFGIEKPGETIDGGAGQPGTGTKLTKEKLAAMSPAEIQKLDWEEVKKVMAGQ